MKRLFFLWLVIAGCAAQDTTVQNANPSPPGAGGTPEQEMAPSDMPKASAKEKSKEKPAMALTAPNADPLAPSPEITSGKVEIKGSLASDEVVGVIRKSLPGLKFCYDEARQLDPTLSGKMKINFIIDSNGNVNDVKTSEGIASKLDECISRKFAQFKFPPPSNGTNAEVSYPLVFTAN